MYYFSMQHNILHIVSIMQYVMHKAIYLENDMLIQN